MKRLWKIVLTQISAVVCLCSVVSCGIEKGREAYERRQTCSAAECTCVFIYRRLARKGHEFPCLTTHVSYVKSCRAWVDINIIINCLHSPYPIISISNQSPLNHYLKRI